MLPLILKIAAIGWVGSVMLIGLLINGKRLYGWVGSKAGGQVTEMHRILDLMFVEITFNRLWTYYTIYLCGLFGLGLFLLAPSLAAGIIVGTLFILVGWKIPRSVLGILWRRRMTRFVVQMVDGLSLMSNSLRSGLNVPQALQLVTEEMPNPISQEFALVLSQNKLGTTLEEALSNLSVRMPHDDIEMFTTAVNILKETGGNLAETFDSISFTIRERIKVESKIAAMTSQGVLQGVIVVLMPFALGAILYTITPERIRPMFTTIPGWAMLLVMMTLQAIGAFAIWKIVRIRV